MRPAALDATARWMTALAGEWDQRLDRLRRTAEAAERASAEDDPEVAALWANLAELRTVAERERDAVAPLDDRLEGAPPISVALPPPRVPRADFLTVISKLIVLYEHIQGFASCPDPGIRVSSFLPCLCFFLPSAIGQLDSHRLGHPPPLHSSPISQCHPCKTTHLEYILLYYTKIVDVETNTIELHRIIVDSWCGMFVLRVRL